MRQLLHTTAFTLVLLILIGCEVATSVKVNSGPSFSLHGSGRLASFRVYGPQAGHSIATPFDSKSLMWRIEPTKGYFRGSSVAGLGVQYGHVPGQYRQTNPAAGTAPALSSGQIYYFFAETTDAPPAEGFFYMDGNTPVRLNVPGLCQSNFVGDVRPLKCGTQEPYSEPSDLREFVNVNRVRD